MSQTKFSKPTSVTSNSESQIMSGTERTSPSFYRPSAQECLQTLGVFIIACVILAAMYNNLGLGSYKATFYTTAFALVASILSLWSELGVKRARWRINGSALVACGWILVAMSSGRSDLRVFGVDVPLLATGAVLSFGGVLCLSAGVVLGRVAREDRETMVVTTITTFATVNGFLGAPFLSWWLA